jgi:hypothetical protein
VPHINVGDLLYAEVAGKTPLGLEAQRHMDSSKTVPDKLLMRLLLERLKQQDCQTCGWVLDGFPHTRKQVKIALWCTLAPTMCDTRVSTFGCSAHSMMGWSLMLLQFCRTS